MNNSLFIKLLLTFIISFIVSFAYYRFNEKKSIIEMKNYELKYLQNKVRLLNDKYNEMYIERYYAYYEGYNDKLKKDSVSYYMKDIETKILKLNNRFLALKKDTAELKQSIKKLKRQQEIIKNDTIIWDVPWGISYEYGDGNIDKYSGIINLKTFYNNDSIIMVVDSIKLIEHASIINLNWQIIQLNRGVQVMVNTNHPSFKLVGDKGVYIKYPDNKRK